MQGESELRGAQAQRGVGGERKRRTAELHRIDAQQQVVHDRVADHGYLEDVRYAHLRFARHLGGERVECAAHRRGHLLGAARMHHRVGHAAHEIFAEPDLRIHRAAGGDHLAAFKIAQVGRDGSGAHVHRQTVDAVVESRPDADEL